MIYLGWVHVFYSGKNVLLKKLGTESAVAKGENCQGWEVQLGSGSKVDDGKRVRDG